MGILRRLFSGRNSEGRVTSPLPDQFPGVTVSILTIEGEENIFALLEEKLSRYGITVVQDGEGSPTHAFSFWTREQNVGFPIRWGVRLILRASNGAEIGDQILDQPFLTEENFAAFVATWIVERLKVKTVTTS